MVGRTYATLDVPPEVYDIVRQRLLEAGYDHLVDGDAPLHLYGVALVAEPTLHAPDQPAVSEDPL